MELRELLNQDFSLAPDLRWYCAFTPPGKEDAARYMLDERGYLCFRPVRKVHRYVNRHRKKKVEKFYPVLPRYLFVGVASPLDLEPLLFMDLIQGFLSQDGKKRELGQFEMKTLMQLNPEAPDYHAYMLTHQEYEPGDDVEILTGPYAGHLVTVDRIIGKKDNARAQIRVNVFNREMEVLVPLDNLVKKD